MFLSWLKEYLVRNEAQLDGCSCVLHGMGKASCHPTWILGEYWPLHSLLALSIREKCYQEWGGYRARTKAYSEHKDSSCLLQLPGDLPSLRRGTGIKPNLSRSTVETLYWVSPPPVLSSWRSLPAYILQQTPSTFTLSSIDGTRQ